MLSRTVSIVGAILLPVPVLAVPTYRITDLGSLGISSEARAINNKGDIVGESHNGSYWHAFLYSGGVLSDLTPGILGYTTARSINDAGDIVLNGGLLSNGSFRSLTERGIVAVNNSAQYVANDYHFGGHAYLYSNDVPLS